MGQLKDFVPVRLTNSDEKYQWLDTILRSAETRDGEVVVAAVAVLIDEVIRLQEHIAQLGDTIRHQR